MNKVRKRIIFYGRVQGVGFRYRARDIADSLGITGWVRNCYDGSVEMEAQGTEAGIDRMIVELKNQRFIEIDDVDMKEINLEHENSFSVRGY